MKDIKRLEHENNINKSNLSKNIKKIIIKGLIGVSFITCLLSLNFLGVGLKVGVLWILGNLMALGVCFLHDVKNDDYFISNIKDAINEKRDIKENEEKIEKLKKISRKIKKNEAKRNDYVKEVDIEQYIKPKRQRNFEEDLGIVYEYINTDEQGPKLKL